MKLICLEIGGLPGLTKNKVYKGKEVNGKYYLIEKDDNKETIVYPSILFKKLED